MTSKSKCALCEKPFKNDKEADECFCFGCKAFVCDDCDVSDGSLGRGHKVDDHAVAPDEDE